MAQAGPSDIVCFTSNHLIDPNLVGTEVHSETGVVVDGTYAADLCVTSNDPGNDWVVVPVELLADYANGIFCDSFEDDPDDCDTTSVPDVYESGPVNHPLNNSIDGTSVDWITGEIVDADIGGMHFNPYNNTAQLTFWWMTGAPDIAGVSSLPTNSDFLVLGSGDVVGPASTWSTVNNPGPAAWAAGATGYLGFRFNCSSLPTPPSTGICYGYVRLQTTGPKGYPATLLNYAYDRAGNAIVIP